MKAVIYARVSSDPRQLGRSVAEQEQECRAVAARNGWDVTRVFVDNDRSASRYATKERPAFAELIQYIELGAVQALVTWEASRLQRDLAAYVKLRELCWRNGVLWNYSGRTYDLSRADDRRMSAIDAVMAEGESDQTRERVLRAVRANAERGRPHGRLTYGYRRVYDPDTRELRSQIVDDAQAAVLSETASRFLAGESFYALAREYETRGTPAPAGTHWHPTNLRRLLMNPAYIGKRVHRGVIVGDADWPAIFTDATWWQLQARLSDPARTTRRDGAVRHLLTGLAECGTCGEPVRLSKNRGLLSYFCPRGFHVSRRQDAVDELVEGVIVARLSRSDAIDLLHDGGEFDDAVRDALSEAAEKRARLATFYDAAAAGDLTAAALSRIERHLLAEIAAAEDRARKGSTSTVLTGVIGPDIADRWGALPITTRREVIRTLARVTILPWGSGRRVFDPDSVRIEPRT